MNHARRTSGRDSVMTALAFALVVTGCTSPSNAPTPSSTSPPSSSPEEPSPSPTDTASGTPDRYAVACARADNPPAVTRDRMQKAIDSSAGLHTCFTDTLRTNGAPSDNPSDWLTTTMNPTILDDPKKRAIVAQLFAPAEELPSKTECMVDPGVMRVVIDGVVYGARNAFCDFNSVDDPG